jgi:ATP-dependent RNA circularization protein (DNA/RNA ligase family)
VYNPATVLTSDIKEVTALITEVQGNIREGLTNKKNEREWDLKYQTLKSNCEVLEGLLKSERAESKKNLRNLLQSFDNFKAKHSNLGSNFDEFL